ncbi:MAG: DNA repair protein RecO [Hyphomicrobiaceae bacterium]|nr:MAG: DNA repair protein RecO [Hyphomicrobiaceae bacterium]
MHWKDEGVVLATRAHGENASVIEVFTRSHGRHLGLVMGGRSRRMRPVLQPGNHVEMTWRARLEEHLGLATLELRRGYAASAIESPMSLAAISSMAELLRMLPERDPHPNLFEITLFVLEYLCEPAMLGALMVRWELALLDDLGFGLELDRCAATGAREDLVFVSPKSGRAVSRAAGEPYADRLLSLPVFLRGGPAGNVNGEDLAAGLRLTGHFLLDRALKPRGLELPEPRQRFAAAARRALEAAGRAAV